MDECVCVCIRERGSTLYWSNKFFNLPSSLCLLFRPDLSLKTEGGSAGHLRCGKGSTWEGGVRLPAIAWWTGKVRHGRTHQLTSVIDLFPTIVKLAGGSMPKDRKIDGMDISRVLFRKNGKVSLINSIVHHSLHVFYTSHISTHLT